MQGTRQSKNQKMRFRSADNLHEGLDLKLTKRISQPQTPKKLLTRIRSPVEQRMNFQSPTASYCSKNYEQNRLENRVTRQTQYQDKGPTVRPQQNRGIYYDKMIAILENQRENLEQRQNYLLKEEKKLDKQNIKLELLIREYEKKLSGYQPKEEVEENKGQTARFKTLGDYIPFAQTASSSQAGGNWYFQ